MRKAVSAIINGKDYPLCLTVGAVDDLDLAGYRIDDVSRLLSPKEGLTLEQLVKNTTWLAAILIREGEQNRHLCAGAGDQLHRVPTLEELSHILTPADALALRPALMEAMAASLSMGIQADHEAAEKNGADAVQA